VNFKRYTFDLHLWKDEVLTLFKSDGIVEDTKILIPGTFDTIFMHELFELSVDNVCDWGDIKRVGGGGGDSERIRAKGVSFLAWLAY
jgi:hypothetical protein